MVATLDYGLKKAPPELYEGGQWIVLTQLILYANVRNRCWPTMRTLASRLNKSLPYVTTAKQWLIDHGAIELVPFEQRVGEERNLSGNRHVYQLTGILKFDQLEVRYLHVDPENGEDGDESEDQRSESSTPLKINVVNDQFHEGQSISSIGDSTTPNSEDTSVSSTPPKGSRWIASSASDAVLHLCKANAAKKAHPYCKASVKARVDYASGLACAHRPPCPECMKIAEEIAKPKPPLEPKPEEVALAELCYGTASVLAYAKTIIAVRDALCFLRSMSPGMNERTIRAFGPYWLTTFLGKQKPKPTLKQVRDDWANFEEFVKNGGKVKHGKRTQVEIDAARRTPEFYAGYRKAVLPVQWNRDDHGGPAPQVLPEQTGAGCPGNPDHTPGRSADAPAGLASGPSGGLVKPG